MPGVRTKFLPFLAVPLWACGSTTPASVDSAVRCLREADLRFVGPTKRAPDDTDAPDTTVLVSGRAYLGWYDDPARAERAAPEQAEHAKEFSGSVERHGGLTIIWLGDEGDAVRDCALD